MFAATPPAPRLPAESTVTDRDDKVQKPSRDRESEQSFDELAKLFAFLGSVSESPAEAALVAKSSSPTGESSHTSTNLSDNQSLVETSVITAASVEQSAKSALGTQHEQMIAANLLEQVESTETQLDGAGEVAAESRQEQPHSFLTQRNQNEQSHFAVTDRSFAAEADIPERTQSIHRDDANLADKQVLPETIIPTTETSVELSHPVHAKPSPPEVTSAKVIQQVVTETMAHMGVTRSGESSTITVRLDPPELGEVLVRIKKLDGGISMRIAAIEPTTMQILQDHHSDLADALSHDESQVLMDFGTEADFQENSHMSQELTTPWRQTTIQSQQAFGPKTTGIQSDSQSVANNIHDFLA